MTPEARFFARAWRDLAHAERQARAAAEPDLWGQPTPAPLARGRAGYAAEPPRHQLGMALVQLDRARLGLPAVLVRLVGAYLASGR